MGTSESALAYTRTLKVQSPLSWGRKVTDAVIWRKMAAISDWISASVFSAVGAAEGAEFSPSAGFEDLEDFDFVGWKIWT